MIDQIDGDDDGSTDTDRDAGVHKPMDGLACHGCGAPISANTTLAGNDQSEWTFRGGVCADCNYTKSAVVTVGDAGPNGLQQKRLDRKQANVTNPQDVEAAAVFLDDVPAGRYEVRRVGPMVVQVIVPDGIDGDAIDRLADRYKRASDGSGRRVWFVRAFEDRINLVDFQQGTKTLADVSLAAPPTEVADA